MWNKGKVVVMIQLLWFTVQHLCWGLHSLLWPNAGFCKSLGDTVGCAKAAAALGRPSRAGPPPLAPVVPSVPAGHVTRQLCCWVAAFLLCIATGWGDLEHLMQQLLPQDSWLDSAVMQHVCRNVGPKWLYRGTLRSVSSVYVVLYSLC